MLSKDIRRNFLEFFKSKHHEIVPSDSLVPKKDPSLLFTSAGMNQFKEQFLGHNITYKRATSSQKCLRTADLEKVGKTSSHHTFFEMLGNFSFGDYFKKEAIKWAWEFMTDTLNIDKEKLWVSVYKNDGESYDIWKDIVKVPKEKIVKLGAKDNFWPSNAPKGGPNGPCGPCSEIFYDWGKETGCRKKSCDPSCSCGRFVEVWNLVFTQFDRKDKGKLDALPTKNIDTGMGLERITSVMQQVKTNFETDLFKPIIELIKTYNAELKKEDLSAIADHIRAVTFTICDGVAPSNEERGYVVRKLIRRAYLRGGLKEPFLYNLVPKVAEVMKEAYPELKDKREEISLIVKEEEEKFTHTLSVAIPILAEDLKSSKKKALSGEKIFKLVDTYGLPIEIIEIEAHKKNMKLDKKEFQNLMEKAREISRKKSKIDEDIFTLNIFAKAPKTSSSLDLPLKTKVVFIVKDKKIAKTAEENDTVELITDPESASFYAEAGGQIGDTGLIKKDKSLLKILNTVKIDNRVIHVARVSKGRIKEGDAVEITLDVERRKRIAKNHTATHLLHSALRSVLGEHVHQAGSLVAEDRLRFDFTHMKKLTDRELEKIESIVNTRIKDSLKISKEKKSLDEAKKEGAIALFGEKYDKEVSVITAGDFSKEVCGGTHVDNTNEIEIFKIVRESSIASGVRRIEAVTSDRAREWIKESETRKRETEKAKEKKEEEKRLKKERLKKAESNIDELLKKAKSIKGKKIIIEKIENANMGILRNLADRIKETKTIPLVMLASKEGDRVNLVLAFTKDLVSKGYNASEVIKPMAKALGGSGGGRADFAQAGGKDPSKLEKAFEIAEVSAKEIIEGASK